MDYLPQWVQNLYSCMGFNLGLNLDDFIGGIGVYTQDFTGWSYVKNIGVNSSPLLSTDLSLMKFPLICDVRKSNE